MDTCCSRATQFRRLSVDCARHSIAGVSGEADRRDSGGRVARYRPVQFGLSISVPPSASVSVFSPKQGAAWHIGASQRIEWTTSGQNIAYVNIYYTTDGGKSFSTIAEKVKNLGMYDWVVPKTPSQMARVRIFVVNAKGENLAMGESGAFLIIV